MEGKKPLKKKVKYLGVMINNKLCFKKHIEQIMAWHNDYLCFTGPGDMQHPLIGNSFKRKKILINSYGRNADIFSGLNDTWMTCESEESVQRDTWN